MPALPRVIIGMPHYGDVSIGAARSLFVGPSAGEAVEILGAMDIASSLLAHSFNCLLAYALDERDKGKATHFAMIHADVQPDYYWLDTLATEMARTKADLISCVIPLKSPVSDPETSTGIGCRSDPWKPISKFRVSQRESMPVTFGPKDCGCTDDEFLAVNTGCWLADLRKPWWDDFSFNITSRTYASVTRECVAVCCPGDWRKRTDEAPAIRCGSKYEADANGAYPATCSHCGASLAGIAPKPTTKRDPRDVRTRPEDWELSRHLDAAGARVRATWAVPIRHHGGAFWANR